jgi:hypothetical protein
MHFLMPPFPLPANPTPLPFSAWKKFLQNVIPKVIVEPL